jgi:hypothetical protein
MFLPRQIAHVSSPRADVQGESFPFPQHSAPLQTAGVMQLNFDDGPHAVLPDEYQPCDYGVVVGGS